MSEKNKFSDNTFDFTVMLLIAFTGIFIKLLFETTSLKDSNVKPATASIVAYSLVIISIVSLLFVKTALGRDNIGEKDINKFFSDILQTIPAFLMLSITFWMLYININYYDRINKGNLTDEYGSASFISSILQSLQIAILFVSYNTPDSSNDGDNSFISAAQENISSLTYLLTIANILFAGIINLILEFFHTDG